MEKTADSFIWKTKDGRLLKPADMDTTHIFNTIKMLWNHTAPESMKIQPYIFYADISSWSHDKIRDAVINFAGEIINRKDLTIKQKSDFEIMLNHINLHYKIKVAGEKSESYK